MEEEDKEASAEWEDDEEDGIAGTVFTPEPVSVGPSYGTLHLYLCS